MPQTSLWKDFQVVRLRALEVFSLEVTYHFKPGGVNITINERFNHNLTVSQCILVVVPSHVRVCSRTLRTPGS